MGNELRRVAWWTCDHCGKRGYRTRKNARRIAKVQKPDRRRLYAYQCDGSDFWHVGHVPTLIRNGQVDRHDYRSARP